MFKDKYVYDPYPNPKETFSNSRGSGNLFSSSRPGGGGIGDIISYQLRGRVNQIDPWMEMTWDFSISYPIDDDGGDNGSWTLGTLPRAAKDG